MTEITAVTKSIIKPSLRSDFKNFEDDLQYNCALKYIASHDTGRGSKYIAERQQAGRISGAFSAQTLHTPCF
ncbi:MAG: hypothetical protein H7320_06875 [Ferruginibacter sp.]|nr:hypothetical protein [Ferruginibacter sp.]